MPKVVFCAGIVDCAKNAEDEVFNISIFARRANYGDLGDNTLGENNCEYLAFKGGIR